MRITNRTQKIAEKLYGRKMSKSEIRKKVLEVKQYLRNKKKEEVVKFAPLVDNTLSKDKLVIILICSKAEWKAVISLYKDRSLHLSPFGEYFEIKKQDTKKEMIFFQTGCGKVNASAATQYVIDHWNPDLLINLGTCGGFEGEVKVGDVITVNETVIYDILEELGTIGETLESYRTKIDISWIKKTQIPINLASIMVSADRDVVPDDIAELKRKYKAIAADWESGSIAYIADKNNIKCLIQRGVSDIVGDNVKEIYGNYELFEERAALLIKKMVEELNLFFEEYR